MKCIRLKWIRPSSSFVNSLKSDLISPPASQHWLKQLFIAGISVSNAQNWVIRNDRRVIVCIKMRCKLVITDGKILLETKSSFRSHEFSKWTFFSKHFSKRSYNWAHYSLRGSSLISFRKFPYTSKIIIFSSLIQTLVSFVQQTQDKLVQSLPEVADLSNPLQIIFILS